MCSKGGIEQTVEEEEEEEERWQRGVRCACRPRSKNCGFESSNFRGMFDPKRSIVDVSCQPLLFLYVQKHCS